MSLFGRLDRLEKIYHADGPLTVQIWAGIELQESRIEWKDDAVDFYVRTLDPDADPMEHLTDEMRRTLAPGDSVVIFEVIDDGRDPDLHP